MMLPMLALVITFSRTGTSALAVNKHAQMKLLKEDIRALRGDIDLEVSIKYTAADRKWRLWTVYKTILSSLCFQISNPQGTVRMAEVLRRRRGSPADQQDYVDAHNEARFAVSPKAANMKKMVSQRKEVLHPWNENFSGTQTETLQTPAAIIYFINVKTIRKISRSRLHWIFVLLKRLFSSSRSAKRYSFLYKIVCNILLVLFKHAHA